MKPQPFRKQAGQSEDTFSLQSNVEASFGNLSRSIILDGTLLESVSVSASGTQLAHKLGRTYRGYIIVKNSTLCTFSDSASPDDSLFINIKSSVDTTVSLWVF